MKIVVIGAGELGQMLAERLSASHHDIVLVDREKSEFAQVRDKLDVGIVTGDATNVSVLKRAGILNADLLLAVSGDQPSNMLACQLARHFHCGSAICRVYSSTVFSASDGVGPEFFGIDQWFSSPEECHKHIMEVLRYQCVLEQMEFSNPEATMVTVRLREDAPIAGKSLKELDSLGLMGAVRLAALVRNRQLKFPRGDSKLLTGDRIYIAGRRNAVESFLVNGCGQQPPTGRLVIIGGATPLSELLVKSLQKNGMRVHVIEPDAERQEEFLGKMPEHVDVCGGDPTDSDVLAEAGIRDCYAYIGAEGEDERNILSCILAKRMGAGKVIAVTHKPEYISMVPEMELIDCGFNSTVESANAVFRLMNSGTIHVDSNLQSFHAYLAEFKIQPTSRLIGKLVREARLPHDVILAMIFRDQEVITPVGDTMLDNGDVVVAIVTGDSEAAALPYFSS
ncbi:MAG: Trk system potassium transporter TrkA [Victivallales bacterium]|nr:Trk system potassium transporter TrkA [Victivallales bacterium]